MDASTLHKIQNLTPYIGSAYAGLGPDSRVLLTKGRKQAQAYFRTYQVCISTCCNLTFFYFLKFIYYYYCCYFINYF